MSKYVVMICVDEGDNVVSLDKCRKVILYDIINRTVVEIVEIDRDFNVDLLEQYIDRYDPYLLFTCNSSSELVDLVEETGIHVYIVNCPIKYTDLVDKI